MAPVSSKKRPATNQSGPATKKAKADASKATTKKRSRPVTQTAVSSAELDSDGDEAGIVDEDDDMAWVDEEEEVEEEAEEQMVVDEVPLVAKDPNAARESHKAQRILQDARRAAKPHSSLLAESKRLWSQAHRKDITPAERKVHITALMAAVQGHIVEIVFKHDASRIVQTLVKHGGQKERDIVASELKGRYRELSQNKYSKFLVTKLIRLCPTHRPSILLEFSGHVLRLLLHRDASTVLADAFELHANAYERTLLLRDFYGKEVALFQGKNAAVEPADKELARRGLEGVLDGTDIERKKRIIQAVKESLLQIFNNPDKGAVTHAITHRVFWEYLVALNTLKDAAEREKGRREMFEVAQDVFAEMVHTKDGSRVVREFLAQGNAKDRKQILKTLKPHVARMCIDDEAQLVLFTALDVVDDTKLTIKTLVTDIIGAASTLHTTPQGRRSLLYLLVPRSRRHFTPAVIASLASTDAARALTSKKDTAVRQNEIRAGASAGLIEWVAKEGGEVCREPGGSLVVAEVMLFATGDKTQASHTLLQAIATPYPSPDEARPHGIDLPHTSRMYKTLLQGGHFDRTTNAIEQESNWDSKSFAEMFVDDVGPKVSLAMCVQGEMNGAFVIAELCGALIGEGGTVGREKVKKWFDDKVRKEVKDSESKGKRVLMERIALL